MKDLIIIGASGFGKEVAWLVERINEVEKKWNILGFIDDSEDKKNISINGYPVIGTTDDISRYPNAFYICALGSSKLRKKVIDRINPVLNKIGADYATLIDPSVVMSKYVKIGKGSIICANSIITTNIQIGNHVIINLSCTIGHDSILSDFVTFYPSINASGNSRYGECVEIGTGSQIIQGKQIGSNTIVGAGAVVIKDLPENCTAVGIPATPIKFNGE